MNGETYLRSKVDELIDQVDAGHRVTAEERAKILGISEGLVVADRISVAESNSILSRLDEVTNPAHSSHALSVEAPAEFSVSRRLSMLLATRTQESIQPKISQVIHQTPRLLRVVPLAGVPHGESDAVTLICIEVWSTFISVHLAHPSTAEMSEPERTSDQRVRALEHKDWDGYDDVSNSYQEVGAHWFDAHGLLVETRIFQPGPTSQVREIVLRTDLPDPASELTLPLYWPQTR